MHDVVHVITRDMFETHGIIAMCYMLHVPFALKLASCNHAM